MRTINVEEITKHIKEMCIEANHFLSKDMDAQLLLQKCIKHLQIYDYEINSLF